LRQSVTDIASKFGSIVGGMSALFDRDTIAQCIGFHRIP
jgi:hypothetical protein